MRKLLILAALFLTSIAAFAQGAAERNPEWAKLSLFLEDLEKHKGDYIGKPAKVLYDKLRASVFRIRDVGLMETSIPSHPKNKSFLTGLYLYDVRSDASLKERKSFIIDVSLNCHVDSDEFWGKLPEGNAWMEHAILQTMNYIVTDISCSWFDMGVTIRPE
jgi:hypothetical protein